MPLTLLQLSSIQKRFGGVCALSDARLDVRQGEVHGLIGENGAGKSTLINIATGLFPPDSGVMILNGETVSFHTPRQAAGAGIHVVHQEAELFAQLSIAENMLLGEGLVRRRGGFIHWGRTRAEAARRIAAVGENFNVRADAGGLPVARRTMAEIASVVAAEPRILFLDEPTASLTVKEAENLFHQIRRLAAAGVGIVYVSHRLEEVQQICDRVTVMRDGATVSTHAIADISFDAMVAEMVGREMEAVARRDHECTGAVRLEVNGLRDREGAFHDVSFKVRAGEIAGLYGFVGAGRSETAQVIAGLRRARGGTVLVDGQPCNARSIRQAVRAGIAYLPEDRLVQGVFREHSLMRNASVTALPRIATATLIHSGKERAVAQGVVQDMHVRTSGIDQPMGNLSGGNQQKVVFGRWAATKPKVFLLDEPTRGVDVSAKGEIHRLIREYADGGAAVLLISSELPEIMAMSDRVITLAEGRITGEFDPARHGSEEIAAAAVPRAAAPSGQTAAPWSALGARLIQLREIGILSFILLLAAAMIVLRPAEFANTSNFLDILASAAIPAMLAQGAMLIICTGGIDISVGSMLALVGALAALSAKAGLPPLACLALAMTAGCLCSLANAGASIAARIHPIIVTLAGISIYRGLMRVATGGREVMLLPPEFRALADGRLLGVPKICYYVIAVTLLVHILLQYRVIGRQILAVGNSESAARLIGLSKARLTLVVFAINGMIVGLCAVLHSGYYGKVQANTGAGMELQAIAAAVIGGANILGGRGSAIGALLGAILVALLYNSLVLLGADAYWQNIFVGALILAAVITDALITRMRRAPR